MGVVGVRSFEGEAEAVYHVEPLVQIPDPLPPTHRGPLDTTLDSTIVEGHPRVWHWCRRRRKLKARPPLPLCLPDVFVLRILRCLWRIEICMKNTTF